MIAFQLTAIAFAMFAMAEFLSKDSGSRKFGYLCAVSFWVVAFLLSVILNAV